jgi:hypothetical protein
MLIFVPMSQFSQLLYRAMLPLPFLLPNAGCDQNVDQTKPGTPVVESATRDELQSMSEPVTKPKLSGPFEILLSLQDYKKREILLVTHEKVKAEDEAKFKERLKILGIGLDNEGYEASTLKDLPEQEQKAIDDWLNTNEAWIILTGVDLKLGEGERAVDVDFKKFIEAQYFDFLFLTNFASGVWNSHSDVDIDKASLDHAERTLELLDRELEKYPDFDRGLYRHEQLWVAQNAKTLEEMGYETLTGLKVGDHLDKSELRKALEKFIYRHSI